MVENVECCVWFYYGDMGDGALFSFKHERGVAEEVKRVQIKVFFVGCPGIVEIAEEFRLIQRLANRLRSIDEIIIEFIDDGV